MSRIHDALERAQEENVGASPRASIMSAPGEVLLVDPNPPHLSSPGLTPIDGSGTTAPQIGVANPLVDCVQREWNPDLQSMLFFQARPDGRGEEEFRTLRARLYQIRENQPLKKLLVTSALPKEGKTMVAANLAQVMACQKGRRTLLIDADLRWSRLHVALGAAPTPGLTEYLRGDNDEFSILQRGPLEGLFFIPGGHANGHPLELLHNGRLHVLLSRMEPLFDWIILDSPPALPVSDASLLAQDCDGVLAVVHAASTPFDVARKLRQEFTDKQLIGVVLNRVATSSAYSQYYLASNGSTRHGQDT